MYNYIWSQTQLLVEEKKLKAPHRGLEPLTFRFLACLKAERSTNWANKDEFSMSVTAPDNINPLYHLQCSELQFN